MSDRQGCCFTQAEPGTLPKIECLLSFLLFSLSFITPYQCSLGAISLLITWTWIPISGTASGELTWKKYQQSLTLRRESDIKGRWRIGLELTWCGFWVSFWSTISNCVLLQINNHTYMFLNCSRPNDRIPFVSAFVLGFVLVCVCVLFIPFVSNLYPVFILENEIYSLCKEHPEYSRWRIMDFDCTLNTFPQIVCCFKSLE